MTVIDTKLDASYARAMGYVMTEECASGVCTYEIIFYVYAWENGACNILKSTNTKKN